MAAEKIEIHPLNPQPSKIERVVNCIKNGGIVIYPTDTVYGIGCSLIQPKAIEKLCKIQNLNVKKLSLSFICYDLSHISNYTRNFPDNIFKIMKKTLPGPYTYILNANSQVPKIVHTKKNTVGIRVPDHAIPRLLVKELGNPIVNASIKDPDEVVQYTVDPEDIYERYKQVVDMVIFSGPGGNIPSTILDCTENVVEIVREGLGPIEVI